MLIMLMICAHLISYNRKNQVVVMFNNIICVCVTPTMLHCRSAERKGKSE